MLVLCATLPLSAAKAVFDFNAFAPGTEFAMSGGKGNATVVENPAGQGRVLEVKCADYNNVPLIDITLPEGITLGACRSLAVRLRIPSAGNEQYANYKQMQIYVDGSLVFRNTKADGSDDYPKQGDKDTWLAKTCTAGELNLTPGQDALRSFSLGIGLNDNAMTYYIADVSFSYDLNVGDPVLPDRGAYYTGRYRNLFAEAGYTEEQVQQRIDRLWATYFEGDKDTERLYYEAGTDMAYILDVNNNDVRTEGMSYGMMLCVQLDRKPQFDALWKWAKTYMQYPANDERRGYFSWQCNTDGSKKGNTPASDGEEYFVMALMFASNRWGDGEGIFDYGAEANYILDMCLEKPAKDINPHSSYTQLFNPEQMQVVFVPYASAARFTDPSYHLPAFYELWSMWADSNRDFYAGLAAKSREMFPKFANATTGLMPDYADFDGSPHQGDGDHSGFLYDAWRCIMNMAMDYAWFKPSGAPYVELVKRQQNFFLSKGITEYNSVYTLDGQNKNGNTDHSPGLVACNASGSLASDSRDTWLFVENFFDTDVPTGRYRYYDGCLYFLNWLNCAGRYRIYKPGGQTGLQDASTDCAAPAISRQGDVLIVGGDADGRYAVYSLTCGRQLDAGMLRGGIIDISALQPGAYAVSIISRDEHRHTYKFIK